MTNLLANLKTFICSYCDESYQSLNAYLSLEGQVSCVFCQDKE